MTNAEVAQTNPDTGAERKKPQKVFRFQGIKKHLDVLKEQTTKIKGLEEKIRVTTERLSARIEEFRKQTGQKELYDKKTELQSKIDALKKERAAMIAETKGISQELRAMMQAVGEEKKKLNLKSSTELKNKLLHIENRIREKPLTSREEKEISAEKNRIVKLLSMQDIFKEKDEKIKELEDKKKAKDTELSIKKQEIELQLDNLKEVNTKIEKTRKTLYPDDIKKMQADVKKAIEEKKAEQERKREEIAVMEKKSKEYELKSAEIEKAKQHKADLQKQEELIAQLQKKKEEVEAKIKSNPKEQLKSLAASLSVYERTIPSSVQKGPLSLPMQIVNQLIRYRVDIPKTKAEIQGTLEKIQQISVSEEKAFHEKKEKLTSELEGINASIKAEREKHQKLPRPVFPRLFE